MDMIRERFADDLPALKEAAKAAGERFWMLHKRLKSPYGDVREGGMFRPRTRPWFEEPESEWPRY